MRIIDTLVDISKFPREQVVEDVLEATVARVEALEKQMAGQVPEEDMKRPPGPYLEAPRFDPIRMEQAYIRSQEDTILRVIFDDLDKLKKGQAEQQARLEQAVLEPEPDIAQLDLNALKGDVRNLKEQINKMATSASLEFWEQHFHSQFRDTDSTIRCMKQDLKNASDRLQELRIKQANLFPLWVMLVLMFAMAVAGGGLGYALGVS